MNKVIRLLVVSGIVLPLLIMAGEKRAMMPEDYYALSSISDPQVSPDGKRIIYAVSVPDIENNSSNRDLWIIPFEGGKPRRLTHQPESDGSPVWSPCGKKIAFISGRSGTDNIWLLSMDGGEAVQLTDSETDLDSPIWSRDGRFILCTSRVTPQDDPDPENPLEEELPKCKARTINRLLFRQYNTWLGDERNHILLISVEDGTIRDLTPGDFDTPPVSLSSSHDFDISPDGEEVCYVRTDAEVLALSTNHEIYTMGLESGLSRKMTTNPALDREPHYSPNGMYIAYAAMSKPGYESDTQHLAVYDRHSGESRRLTQSLDRSVRNIVWHPGGKRLYFVSQELGRSHIFTVDIQGRQVDRLTEEGYNTNLSITPDGKHLIFMRSVAHRPVEIFTMPSKGGPVRQITDLNTQAAAQFDLPPVEDIWFTGAQGDRVHGLLIKPPMIEDGRKYPLVLVVHGGPQGMCSDSWGSRRLITAPGYGALLLNPRGSTGYGAKFREEVSRDYGGRCYDDLMAGLDYVIEHFDWIDSDRLAAMGGSFGGYMVNWIMGHTDRFKCLHCHAGLYNLVSFFGATEELWFPAWDMGKTPWDEPELYAKWSPHTYAANFKTPTLISHGELDYRVPIGEGLMLFTALQVQGVPSRFLYFPDESHGIRKIQNALRRWKEIFRWFETYL